MTTIITLLQTALLLLTQTQSSPFLSALDQGNALKAAASAFSQAKDAFDAQIGGSGSAKETAVVRDGEGEAVDALYSSDNEDVTDGAPNRDENGMELVYDGSGVLKSTISKRENPKLAIGTFTIKNAPMDVKVSSIDGLLETSDGKSIDIKGYGTMSKFPYKSIQGKGDIIVNFGFKGSEFAPQFTQQRSRGLSTTISAINLVDTSGKTYTVSGPLYLPRVELIYVSDASIKKAEQPAPVPVVEPTPDTEAPTAPATPPAEVTPAVPLAETPILPDQSTSTAQ